jgi:hypothetical protein
MIRLGASINEETTTARHKKRVAPEFQLLELYQLGSLHRKDELLVISTKRRLAMPMP